MKRFAPIAVTFVLIAAIAAWALIPSGEAPTETPEVPYTPSWHMIDIAIPVYGADVPTTSGIENIYIYKTEDGAAGVYDNSNDLKAEGTEAGALLGTITVTAGTANITYDTAFDIIVAVKVHLDNLAYLSVDNMNVELAASNAFTITAENSDNKVIFTDGSPDYYCINVIWDNNNAGYTLHADQTLDIDSCKLWCYY